MPSDTPDLASARGSDFRPYTVEEHRRAGQESLLYAKAAREGRAVKLAMVLWPTATVEAVVPSGAPLQNLAEPEPHAEAVDGAALLDEFAATLDRYLVLTNHQATTLALWALHSWAAPQLASSPRLALISPEPQAGKTTALRALSLLVPRPIFAVHGRTDGLSDIVEAVQPTLLLDDADKWVLRNSRLRAMIAAGATPDGKLLRPTQTPWVLPVFSCFSPCALALSGRVPDDLAKCSITLAMAPPGDNQRRERLDNIPPLGIGNALRAKAVRWIRDNADRLAELQLPEPPLSSHARQTWRPLLLLAEAAGGDWPARAREAAIEISASNQTRSEGVELLEDIRSTFNVSYSDRVTSEALVEQLNANPDRFWGERTLTARSLADRLVPFGIKPRALRFGDGIRRGYRPADFTDAFTRYLNPTAREEVL